MTRYVMGERGDDIQGWWERCQASTLTGAKRESSNRYGGGYSHHRISVAIDHGNGNYQVVAERPLLAAGRWREVR